ncbi:MAG TPA: LysM peptidoglycan-binding domain-containing protein [Candidatus Oscillibacter excrementigallinarum]|uniref:LysM peptidoglycan-binding domain-containing protein n=1 Tax=Candidatus Oscillibacter excrementigallinarum TaxID=2838716 RepID=A0A9D2LI05_9FIRM|nr:LysM peptidoglycan-binding domain-containing protein [Candidatus Oscillibacter excrementigallinarum]
MLDAGLTADEISALKANLAQDYTAEVETPVEEPAEETPEEETPAEEPASQARTYTVEAGDCLWNIAYEVYGTGTRWTVIYEANRDTIRDPGMIYIGQVLTIPAA